MEICKDVLVNILEFQELKYFTNFFLVCKKFHEISKMEYIWKIKFFECINKPIKFKVKTQTADYWICKIKKKKFRYKKIHMEIHNKDKDFFELWRSFFKIDLRLLQKQKQGKDSLIVMLCNSFMSYYFKDDKLICKVCDLNNFEELFKIFYNRGFYGKCKHFIYIFSNDYFYWNTLFKKSSVFHNFIKKEFPVIFKYLTRLKF